MKKFLSVILVVLTILSLTACGTTESYLLITEPGTHPLQMFGPNNPAEDAEWPYQANHHLRLTTYGVGDEIVYLAYAKNYACGKIGAQVKVDNPFYTSLIPTTFENAKVTIELQINYRTFVSSLEYKYYTTDPIYVDIELDEKGVGEAIVWAEIDDEVKNNTYYEGLVQYCGDAAIAGIDFRVIARICGASGTVTYGEKIVPTPIPTATPKATPAA